MEFSEIQNDFGIDMVKSSTGCPERCHKCGFFPKGFRADDLRVQEADIEEMRTMLRTRPDDTRRKLISWFNPDITTDVGTEPLATKKFPQFAELIHYESSGRSSVILIMHGVREGVRKMYECLTDLLDIISRGVIKNIIITMDFSRLNAEISPEKNQKSYFDTLKMLRHVLAMPDRRLAVSLQGDQNRQSPEYIGRVYEMYRRILESLAWSDAELSRLNENWRVSYTTVGRAEGLIPEGEAVDCEVIPDPPLVYEIRKKIKPLYRGRFNPFNRTVEAQRLRPGKTYEDTVNRAAWETVLRL